MIAKRSLLDLANFLLVEQVFQYSHPEGELKKRDLFDSYPIDINFSINTDDRVTFQILVRIEINAPQELPGYHILSTGIGVFDFSKTPEMHDEEKAKFLNLSGVSICINQLRGIISTITANGPFGRYLLPSIDVDDLLKQKVKSVSKEESKRKKSKK